MCRGKEITEMDGFCDMDSEYLAQLAKDREEAEKAGVFEDERIYDCMETPAEQLHLTVEQEMALYSAASSLFNLAKETDSSVSELLKASGFTAN